MNKMSESLPEDIMKIWIVPSSSEKLNAFLDGGFLRGVVYTIYSRQDRGKSNTCLDMAFNAAKMGFKVAYIDGDNHGVTVKRLYTLFTARYPKAKILKPTEVDPDKVYDYYQKILSKYNIDIFWTSTLDTLKNKCKEVAESNEYTVIIVDSVTLFYGEYVSTGGPDSMKKGTGEVTKIYSKLRDSAMNSNHLKILVFTTQRSSDVAQAMRISLIEKKEKHNIKIDNSDREEIDRHMGGKSVGHFSDVIIQLTKFEKKRKAEYVKNRLSEYSESDIAEFEICNAGIV